MAKSNVIELPNGAVMPILFENAAVLAIDKPAGWMLAPDSWRETGRHLFWALQASIQAGDHWARSRQLRYLRYIHRLDAETSGVLLLARSPGALRTYSRLFATHRVEKRYWAVVHGVPSQPEWNCRLKLSPDPGGRGRMKVDAGHGKDAVTSFRVLASGKNIALVEAQPTTGRTHQLRVHLAASGHPVFGDVLYRTAVGKATNPPRKSGAFPLALRAVELSFCDPFRGQLVRIRAATDAFAREFGFENVASKPADLALEKREIDRPTRDKAPPSRLGTRNRG